MSTSPPRRVALMFTLVPAIAGVMFFNLATWIIVFSDDYAALGNDDRFVLGAVLVAMVVAILGGCHSTYGFIRTGKVKQIGLWAFLAAGCIRGEAPNGTLNVIPLSFGVDLPLESSSIGINFLGVGLLLAYTAVLLPKGSPRELDRIDD